MHDGQHVADGQIGPFNKPRRVGCEFRRANCHRGAGQHRAVRIQDLQFGRTGCWRRHIGRDVGHGTRIPRVRRDIRWEDRIGGVRGRGVVLAGGIGILRLGVTARAAR